MPSDVPDTQRREGPSEIAELIAEFDALSNIPERQFRMVFCRDD